MACLVKAATSTFAGLETSSSYKAGLLFKQEIASAERQAALHWKVDGKLSHDKGGEAVLDLTVRDAKGVPVSGLTALARLAHPADRQARPCRAAQCGSAPAPITARCRRAGQWELIIDLDRGGERVFRSRSRVTLK